MDPWTWLGIATGSILANLVVVGFTSAGVIVLGGTAYLPVNADAGKKFVVNGLLLAVALGLLSIVQIGAVPTTFGQVEALGLLALPPWTTAILDVATGVLHGLVTWASNLLIPAGVILTLGKVNWGPKLFLVGVLMSALAAIATGQGLVALAYAALDVLAG